ncbi:hypothetical protein FAM09_18370 [Niastella caeni]|uniref:Uncharacterized protein n=1 Tax=Niastella caeni TaxID=2569763 RepID=A0A4S8HQX5_9BACT|nr:hypothetical protein [Niastella caeni]THU36929.1 hypothetical protein FAM09_18370 [Niastella caeni]
MKLFVFILFFLTSIYASGQQLTSEIQARNGVFTERLYLNGKWIDRISTNLNSSDSANNNVLATGKAIADFMRLRLGDPIKNQFSVAQPANLWIQGSSVIGSHNNFQNTLSSELPAQQNITQSGLQHGLSVQRSSVDQGAANLVLFKNASSGFNTLQALQPGDSIGNIEFSGVAGNNSTIARAMSMHGKVEKTGSTYLNSGFVFNTTDSNGIYQQRMWLNGQGNLLLGNATENPYSLNVASGNVRINSLSGSGDILVGCDNNGVLTKLALGDNIYLEEGSLNVVSPPQGGATWEYVAIASQTGQNSPSMHTLENNMGNIVWTRNSTGNYTGTLVGGFGYQIWFKSEASDENGNAVFTRLFRSSGSTVTLIVKDGTLANTDNWQNISIEIKQWIDF